MASVVGATVSYGRYVVDRSLEEGQCGQPWDSRRCPELNSSRIQRLQGCHYEWLDGRHGH